MADEKTIIMPDNQNNGWGNGIPLALALNGNGFGWGNNYGGGFLGGGFGAGILGGLLGGFLFGGFGNGGFMGRGNNGGQLGTQLNNDSNTALIMQALNGTDANVRALASQTNTDYSAMRDGICSLRSAIEQVAAQTGMSSLQVQNAVLSGRADIISALNQCCCEMKQITVAQGYENQIATLNQTNQLGSAISGSGQRTVDAIADLKTTMVKEFCDVREREMQAKINSQAETITQLRNAADNAAQTTLFQNGFNILNQKITELAAKQPNTVPVAWPNIQAVNTTPTVSAGFGTGLGWGFGLGNGLAF